MEPARVEPGRRAAAMALVVWVAALVVYGKFEHWAGDGSFGPRYLVPFLPLAMLVVAMALDGAARGRRIAIRALGVLGFLVQLGGVAIYYGAQMREAGDYPYTLPLSHPRFMSDSHFNPAFSPIVGHWRMMLRNAGEHLSGHAPRLEGGAAPDERLGISAADQQRLLHALDFWWTYAVYAGVPAAPVWIAALLLLAATIVALRAAYRSACAEARAP
jgi:hypothetical protein